jgi:hypothetical protein
MRAFIAVLPVFACMFPALAQHNLTQAESDWPDLRIMRPGELAELSPALRADLEKRGCRVPKFTRWHAQHNVIRGRFADSTREDVAVLCLAGDDMSIVVYWGGTAGEAETLRKFPANAYRMIHTVTPFVLKRRAIRDQATGSLPPFDHDGIDDGPVGDRVETVYRHAGNWIDVF